jgi:2-dehydro-3-deoxyphosphooctonate aldolase (KDO 8-P synthase)
VAVGVDGVFLEVHSDPEQARCDGPNSLPITDIEDLVRILLAIHDAVKISVDEG